MKLKPDFHFIKYSNMLLVSLFKQISYIRIYLESRCMHRCVSHKPFYEKKNGKKLLSDARLSPYLWGSGLEISGSPRRICFHISFLGDTPMCLKLRGHVAITSEREAKDVLHERKTLSKSQKFWGQRLQRIVCPNFFQKWEALHRVDEGHAFKLAANQN